MVTVLKSGHILVSPYLALDRYHLYVREPRKHSLQFSQAFSSLSYALAELEWYISSSGMNRTSFYIFDIQEGKLTHYAVYGGRVQHP